MVKNVRLSDYQDVGLSKCWIMKMPDFSVSLSNPLCVHVPKPSHVVKQCRNLQLRTYVRVWVWESFRSTPCTCANTWCSNLSHKSWIMCVSSFHTLYKYVSVCTVLKYQMYMWPSSPLAIGSPGWIRIPLYPIPYTLYSSFCPLSVKSSSRPCSSTYVQRNFPST